MEQSKLEEYLLATDDGLYNQDNQVNQSVALKLSEMKTADLVMGIKEGLQLLKTKAKEEGVDKITNFEKYMELVDELKYNEPELDPGEVILRHELLKVYRNIQKICDAN